MIHTLAFGIPGGWEWIIILVIALLIFGRRLPDVGRSLGKGIVEFKKGLKGMKSEMDSINDEVDEAVRNAKDDEDEKPAPRRELDSDRPIKESTPHTIAEKDREKDKVES